MESQKIFKPILLIFISLIIFFYSSSNAISQESIKMNIPFTKVIPINTTTLMGSANHIKAKLPIPERWQIKSAVLNFSYVNSTALLQSRSRLVVWLNEHPIAQITLNPQLPQGKVAVNLPANLLKPGYNELQFTVAHHYTLECEDPSSAELWTTIEFDKASFDFDLSLKKVPENLTAIVNFLFEPKLFGNNEVNLVVADNKEETLELASIVASAVALRFEYRPVNISLSETLKKGVDNIVIGNAEFIKAIDGDLLTDKGSIIKIKTLSNDPYHALIILKGDNPAELQRAVYAFASINFPFPKAKAINVDNIKITPSVPPSGKGVLFPGYEYSFRDVGFFTTNFKGIGAKSQSIDFKLPSYVFLKPNSFLSLKINFSYGSGMRKDSSLNIQINGKYVASIHLDNIRGGYIRNYIIDIPLSLLKPGFNQIILTSVLTPLTAGYCEFIQTDNLQLTIFEDSKILIPSVPKWTAMPDLNLFFVDGFPFSQPLDFSQAGVLIVEENNETFYSAINLIALAAQRSGYIPFKLKISYDREKLKERNIIVVGTMSKIPEEYLKAGNIKLKSGGSFVYYLVRHFEKSESSLNTKLRSIIENYLPIFKAKSEVFHSKAQIDFSGNYEGKWFILSEFESPFKSRNTVLIATASEQESLAKGIQTLWEPSIGAKTGGAITLFDPQAPYETITNYHSDRAYYMGKMGFLPALNAWIYANPVIFTAVMLITIVIFAYLLYITLIKLRRKRLG